LARQAAGLAGQVIENEWLIVRGRGLRGSPGRQWRNVAESRTNHAAECRSRLPAWRSQVDFCSIETEKNPGLERKKPGLPAGS
jgi:hypothetical protein